MALFNTKTKTVEELFRQLREEKQESLSGRPAPRKAPVVQCWGFALVTPITAEQTYALAAELKKAPSDAHWQIAIDGRIVHDRPFHATEQVTVTADGQFTVGPQKATENPVRAIERLKAQVEEERQQAEEVLVGFVIDELPL
jgi:hypothetical protein